MQQQNENYRRGNPDLSDLDQEGIAESVIQRFETCYDYLWKVLKRHLTETSGIAETPNSPKPVFRSLRRLIRVRYPPGHDRHRPCSR